MHNEEADQKYKARRIIEKMGETGEGQLLISKINLNNKRAKFYDMWTSVAAAITILLVVLIGIIVFHAIGNFAQWVGETIALVW